MSLGDVSIDVKTANDIYSCKGECGMSLGDVSIDVKTVHDMYSCNGATVSGDVMTWASGT